MQRKIKHEAHEARADNHDHDAKALVYQKRSREPARKAKNRDENDAKNAQIFKREQQKNRAKTKRNRAHDRAFFVTARFAVGSV